MLSPSFSWVPSSDPSPSALIISATLSRRLWSTIFESGDWVSWRLLSNISPYGEWTGGSALTTRMNRVRMEDPGINKSYKAVGNSLSGNFKIKKTFVFWYAHLLHIVKKIVWRSLWKLWAVTDPSSFCALAMLTTSPRITKEQRALDDAQLSLQGKKQWWQSGRSVLYASELKDE